MSEFIPEKTRETRLTRISDALASGFNILFPKRPASSKRPTDKVGKILEATDTAGISFLYPASPSEKSSNADDINRLTL